MTKLGCTLPNLANVCVHRSKNRMFYPFFEDKDLWEKREDITGGSVVFEPKAVVDQTSIRNSSKVG